ncbi:glycosyltransferase family 2 protein [Pediococcus acidilactici]|uniref:glycosyltransferase family 2 protein n=1 Tax=Pediococcus acidilactici TaxID=1254 RepID=UPI0013297E3E|nr:glycosyltransferase family 2 protein [Pediococcus acidilactici]KAF0338465.1 glycosyltransferase [Pediococcus acidilactici]KAF0378345.1 glycosyltransferase [Pediococcus acidilactici]KAF0388603.1 glycosyltransferase [Pediococcus acidilactici]KAF0451463.1 glycosyltransferase [Pediococcus acidilactici]KAF0460772.1 glycosyltransferase [Pediococcus acidilactici]
MKENITIIIPIYNLEDYLDNCLNSIKKQTYTNFEVLLIDDGSTDKSKQICKFYVKEDSRFKYFYQHNAGVSKARNLGLQKARGKFVTFVDGDDFLNSNHLQDMIDGMEYGQLSISGRNDIYQDKVKQSFKVDKDVVLNRRQLVDGILKPGIIYSFPWNKLYLTKIIKDNLITFNESLDYGEDLVFNMEYVLKINTAILKTDATYNYVYRKNSVSKLMNKKTLSKRITDLKAISYTLHMLPDSFENEQIFLNKRMAIEGAKYHRMMIFYHFNKLEINDYTVLIRSAYKSIKTKLTIKERLKYQLNMKVPHLIACLKNITS